MIIKCIFCNTLACIKNNYVFMQCICDDDFRIVPINDIKCGFHSDKVYLLEAEAFKNKIYEKSNEFKTQICNYCE